VHLFCGQLAHRFLPGNNLTNRSTMILPES
jgi:hypothetical protein